MFKTALKNTAIGLGVVIAVAHIGALGHLMKRPDTVQVPLPPVNEYSSYRIIVTPDGGYQIEYIGNDPRVLENETDVDRRSGFFGLGGHNRTNTTRQFTQDGARNQGGGMDEEGKLSAEDIACIEAAGGGRAQGAIVGGSLASGVVVPAVINIPYVGWLAAGWATLLGTEWGGNMGAEVNTMIQGCL